MEFVWKTLVIFIDYEYKVKINNNSITYTKRGKKKKKNHVIKSDKYAVSYKLQKRGKGSYKNYKFQYPPFE